MSSNSCTEADHHTSSISSTFLITHHRTCLVRVLNCIYTKLWPDARGIVSKITEPRMKCFRHVEHVSFLVFYVSNLLILAFVYFKMHSEKNLWLYWSHCYLKNWYWFALKWLKQVRESVTIKELQVTHWRWVLSASTNMFTDAPLNVSVLQIVCMQNMVGFPLFRGIFCLALLAIIVEMDSRFCLLWLYSPPRFDVETRHAFVGDQSGQVTILKLEQDICSLVTTFKGHTGTS